VSSSLKPPLGAGDFGGSDLDRGIRHRHARRWLAFCVAGALLLVVAMVSTGFGVQTLGAGETVRALLSPLLPARWYAGIGPMQIAVLWDLRLPRTVIAIVGGAGLSIAGVALQGITRNPLVSPYTLGISPAAAFGAALAIFFAGDTAAPLAGNYVLVAAAFASAMVCAAAIIGISALRGVTPIMLILAGVGLTYLFSALTATMQFVATEQQLPAIIHWTFGSLNGSTWGEAAILAVVLAAAYPVLHAHAWALNALASGGDEVATSLGFAVTRVRLIVTIASVLVTASFVSFAGVIGFVGLVAPHIARLLVGGDHRTLLPFSALVGALLLLAADTVGRLAFSTVIIPVGIVVSYLGVPMFLHLMLRRRREMLS
jgi:iron complex transport system permease protein